VTTDESQDSVVQSYSDAASRYDSRPDRPSCWEPVTQHALSSIKLKNQHKLVADVGCGTGRILRELAANSGERVQFVGVEPAEKMRAVTAEALKGFGSVRVVNGRFEDLPLETATVDYVLSVLAFHWTTNVEQSVDELARVLKPEGEMDLFFTGRNTGQEFTQKTTPIFLKYMGPVLLLQSASLRNHLTRETAQEAFGRRFPAHRLTVEESLETYYDDLEGHWSWWVSRAAGHFTKIPPDKRRHCDEEIRQAIQSLEGEKGIPYTVHLLHVRVRD
jgi:ubiquinone/menaquinone biosynthesis C-methylase UbiE